MEHRAISVFDKYSYRYDSWYSRNIVTALNELKAVAALGFSGLGLEIGVGSGWFASRLGVEFGVEPAPSMASMARERGVEVVLSVGEHLPFRSEVFDYVLIIVTLCFVEHPLAVLAEAYRVLRLGGGVGVCIVPRDTPWGEYYSILGERGHPFYSVARFYSLGEVYEMMEKTGFRGLSHIGVLRYGPRDEPVEEEPLAGFKGGFTCIRGYKL